MHLVDFNTSFPAVAVLRDTRPGICGSIPCRGKELVFSWLQNVSGIPQPLILR